MKRILRIAVVLAIAFAGCICEKRYSPAGYTKSLWVPGIGEWTLEEKLPPPPPDSAAP